MISCRPIVNRSSRAEREALCLNPRYHRTMRDLPLKPRAEIGATPCQENPGLPRRQVRIAGVLEATGHNQLRFTTRLKSGEEVHGVTNSVEGVNSLRQFIGKPALILGRAVYDPSGRLLRIMVDGIEDGAGAPSLFTRVPILQRARLSASRRVRKSGSGRRGVPAFFGTWPGDETDADLTALVSEARKNLTLAC